MSLEERVYSVLIVSASEKFNSSLKALFPDFKFSPVRFEKSINSAKRTLIERSFDFVIINSPLPDDTGLHFSIDVCHEKSRIALILVRAELYESTYNKVAEHGVYVLLKPTSAPIISQSIDWMITTCERLKRLEKKTVSIEERMQEIRFVNRAKWILIDQLKMTESDAHRYIEKQAMDNCVSRREIAESIIKTYS